MFAVPVFFILITLKTSRKSHSLIPKALALSLRIQCVQHKLRNRLREGLETRLTPCLCVIYFTEKSTRRLLKIKVVLNLLKNFSIFLVGMLITLVPHA